MNADRTSIRICATRSASAVTADWSVSVRCTGFALRVQPSPAHIAQVRGGRSVENLVDAKLRRGLAQVLEETPPTAEQYGRLTCPTSWNQ